MIAMIVVKMHEEGREEVRGAKDIFDDGRIMNYLKYRELTTTI